jgi:acylpyruvate hydrolase
MKLVRYQTPSGAPALGFLEKETIVAVADVLRCVGQEVPPAVLAADMRTLLQEDENWSGKLLEAFAQAKESCAYTQLPKCDFHSAKILAPISEQKKFICVGLNYRDHCEEQHLEPPKTPVIFAKFSNAICGHKDVVKRPRVTTKLDFEGELGVVIGKRGKKIPAEQALDHVFGYTIVNDVSAREIQKNDGQWLRAKSMDNFAPTGPCIVTRDEINDPQSLALRTTVNGVIMQDSHTSRMIFSVAKLIEFISQGITLEPGDIISTGTPSGVGVWRNPPVFLAPGDVVRIEIEKIGALENTIGEDD